MKKKLLYTLAGALMLITGCGEKPQPELPAQRSEPTTVDYAFTRGSSIPPGENPTFTFVSYRIVGGTAEANPYYTGQNPVGKYAYMTDPKWKGILQPCDIDVDYNYFRRNPQNGQALIDGNFSTVCIHPAMNMVPNGLGSERVLFTKNSEIYASEPFDMTVKGYEIFNLPLADNGTDREIELRDLRSKIFIDIIQGSSFGFTIENVRLINAGYWGWFQPQRKLLTVAYNPLDSKDWDTQSSSEDIDNIAATGDSGLNEIVYSTVDDPLFVFANDYSQVDLSQLSISFDLTMGTGPDASTFKIKIPLNINMKSGTAYRFRLTVESVAIRVKFQVVDWFYSHDNGGDIGEDDKDIPIGIWRPSGWEGIHDYDHDIGEVL